ncbi:MAG: DUF86 domain-containing protein [archaeon]|nr:DUF86 domain-containing protein [archaeon]
MISPKKITQKFMQLDEYIEVLKKISVNPIKIFLNDKILIGSAKYYLQVSIECCLDVANHIISSEKYRAPKDYSDSFKVIEEEGLISSDLSMNLRQMAKFRNRLVHLYGEIDNSFVYEYIKNDFGDILEFKRLILAKISK